MKEYHKIQTVFKRDMSNNGKTLMLDQYSIPEFEYLKDCRWRRDEKVDGTNIRVMSDSPTSVNFGGKTDNASIPAQLISRLRELFDPQAEKLHEMFPGGVCLYGEGYGPKIQKGGGNYGAIQDFCLFDVRVGPWWLERHNVEDVAEKLDLSVAPIIGHGTIAEMVDRVRAGISSIWGNFAAEGIVARPTAELLTRGGHRIITKLKTRDFTK